MTIDTPISAQTHQYFVQESAELLQTMDDELQNLREAFSVQKVHNLMRAAHTLKGASASVGLDAVKTTTHSLEDIFKALCYKDTVISVEMEGLIFQSYDCLKLLMSAQLAGAKVDTADILDRMATVVTQLQDLLGDRFGQGGHLPTSSELGFDMTRSIFEVGVAQRIGALEKALEHPDPVELAELLETQCEVFIGLAESLELPGFGSIATTTLAALDQSPNQVLDIASVALADYKAAKVAILAGDREQGGTPSAALKQFCGGGVESSQLVASHESVASVGRKHPVDWLVWLWELLTRPIGVSIASQQNLGQAQGLMGDRTPQSHRPKALPLTSELDVSELDVSELDTSELDTSELTIQSPFPDPDNGAHHTTHGGSPPTEVQRTHLTPTSPLVVNVPITPSMAEPVSPAAAPLPQNGAQPTDSDPANLNAPALFVGQGARANELLVLTDSAAATETATDPEDANDAIAPTKHQANATIRMTVENLDQLSQSMGELLTLQNRQALYNEQMAALVNKLLGRIARQQKQLNQYREQSRLSNQPPARSKLFGTAAINQSTSMPFADFDALELDQYSDVQLLAQSCLEETVQQSESVEAIELFVARSGQELEKQKRLLANTRETLLSARMLTLGKIFQQFPSAIERLEAQYNKPVNLTLIGDDVLVDKVIADKLYDPLLHLVRNAFGHGIESPERRQQQNKPATGNITIEATQQGRHLVINVKDDGQGLNLEMIRRKAVDNQILTTEEAAQLTPEQTIDLLFEAGFSTKSDVDDLSGRGMGLDAVQAQVRSLQGWVTVSHEPGTGTCFSLQIPSSLTIAKLLLCQAQGRIYALIADAIEHILIPTSQQVRTWEGGKTLTWQANNEEHLISINALADVLHYASPMRSHQLIETRNPIKSTASKPVILMHHQSTLIGLEVDQLLGEQELVISPLGDTISPPSYLYGSSILPDGQLTLVLDGVMLAKIVLDQRAQSSLDLDLADISMPSKPSQDAPVFIRKLILIVDDSMTVRNTLTEALQKTDYQVIQARDGEEALQQLKRYPDIEAILCDIEMPGMNGFEFLKIRQQTPEVAAIPTIMLTSRGGAKHRRLTKELGATTYLTKPYLTPQLLQTISEAIENQAATQTAQTAEKTT